MRKKKLDILNEIRQYYKLVYGQNLRSAKILKDYRDDLEFQWKAKMFSEYAYTKIATFRIELQKKYGIRNEKMIQSLYMEKEKNLIQSDANYREEILKIDNYTCRYCGQRKEENNLQIHHILSRKKEGPDLYMNLVVACKECHQEIGTEFRRPKC